MAKHQNTSKPYTFKTSTDSLQQSCLLKDLNSFILYSGPAARLQLEGPYKLADSKLHVSSHPTPFVKEYITIRAAFLWENPKMDLWSQIKWILHYQKTEDLKKDHLPWQWHVLMLLVMRKNNRGKKQQTDLHRKDKKEKQRKLCMNIQNVHISVWNTNVSWIEYTLR